LVRGMRRHWRIVIAFAAMVAFLLVEVGLHVTSAIRGPVIIGAGPGEGSLVVGRGGGFLYVANFGEHGSPDSTVTVVNLRQHDSRRVIAVGDYPTELATSSDGKKLYVLVDPASEDPVSDGGSIIPVDLTTGTVGRAWQYRGGAEEMELSPDGRMLYAIAGLDSNVLDFVKLPGGSLARQVSLPGEASSFVVSPDRKMLYVVYGNNGDPGSYKLIPEDLATGERGNAVSLPDDPMGIAVSPGGRFAYVTGNDNDVSDIGAHTLMVVDLTSGKVIRRIKLGVTPYGLIVDAARNLVFIQGYESFVDAVSMKTGKMVASLRDSEIFNQGPDAGDPDSGDLAISPDGETLYVSNGQGVAVLPVSGFSGLLLRQSQAKSTW
jgi:DNA-binding beta-propeller fold protein YncE